MSKKYFPIIDVLLSELADSFGWILEVHKFAVGCRLALEFNVGWSCVNVHIWEEKIFLGEQSLSPINHMEDFINDPSRCLVIPKGVRKLKKKLTNKINYPPSPTVAKGVAYIIISSSSWFMRFKTY